MPDKYPWSNYFTDRATGVGIQVAAVTDFWATIMVQTQLVSTFKMPIAQYDEGYFTEKYMPIDTGSLRPTHDEFRPPKNWDTWVEEGLPSRSAPMMTAEDDRDDDEKAVDAISAAEESREQAEAESEATEAPQTSLKPRLAKPVNLEGKDPADLEAAVQQRLAGR